ncbi:unnamed protein product [Ectocarpus sp. CCAP 1310/34]|nr:unnamed protein product [Ectocarpus sp. CCAP 1310/34]
MTKAGRTGSGGGDACGARYGGGGNGGVLIPPPRPNRSARSNITNHDAVGCIVLSTQQKE